MAPSARREAARCKTLAGKILLLSPAFVKNVEWTGDDFEPMPGFEHPEVYQALDGWGHGAITGKIREACERLIAALGEERALRLATDLRVTSPKDWINRSAL